MIKKALMTAGIIIAIISFTGCLGADNAKAAGTMKGIDPLNLFYMSFNSRMTADLEKEMNEVYEKIEAEKKKEAEKKEETTNPEEGKPSEGSGITQEQFDSIVDQIYEEYIKNGGGEPGHIEGNPVPGAVPSTGELGDYQFGSSGINPDDAKYQVQ